jgi:hypothetical protein
MVMLLVLPFVTATSQTNDYRVIFGKDWEKALSFLRENNHWIDPVLGQNHVSYPVAVAVIFPELVRYSAIQDKIEITLLKTLYINLGEDYANFSVGQFQMKPTFAEKIREEAPVLLGGRYSRMFRTKDKYSDIKDYRSSIVSDLEDPEIQLKYLIAFIKICEKNFDLKSSDDTTKVRFLATAYNYGFWKTKDQILNMTDKKYFSTTLFRSENYSYSDVSMFWYRLFMESIAPHKL